MSFERIKLIGLAALCIALTLAARRTIVDASPAGPDQGIRPVSTMQEDGGVWTIPVEIVEVGAAPRLHQVPLRN
jgi:hypothetical protein